VIAAEWRAFDEGLSATEQGVHVAPAIARITEVLSRPALRAVLSQPDPRLNIGQALDEGRWICVATSPGTLGEPAANLLAGVVTYLVWAAVEKRAAIPPERRHQVMLVLDELQSLTHLPVGIEVFFERTRSLNCAVVASSQAASRLSDTTRQSLFANVGSLLTFRGGAKEAERLAPELPPLTAADIAGLARYEIAGRVNTGSLGSGSAVVTGHTEPLPPATGMGAHIRQLSAERYGRDPREVEQELRRRGRGDNDENAGYGRTGRAA
jgi:Type IV secretion-system coupling protein DNA-binding domain